MNFFDVLLILNPFIYGALKAVQDLNRDCKDDTPLREIFYDIGLGKQWDNADGGKTLWDVWHVSDYLRNLVAFTYPFVFVCSSLFATNLWLLGVGTLVSFFLMVSTFILLYKIVFAPPYAAKDIRDFFKIMFEGWL